MYNLKINTQNPTSDLKDIYSHFSLMRIFISISQDIKRVKVKYESPIEYIDYNFLSDYSI